MNEEKRKPKVGDTVYVCVQYPQEQRLVECRVFKVDDESFYFGKGYNTSMASLLTWRIEGGAHTQGKRVYRTKHEYQEEREVELLWGVCYKYFSKVEGMKNVTPCQLEGVLYDLDLRDPRSDTHE